MSEAELIIHRALMGGLLVFVAKLLPEQTSGRVHLTLGNRVAQGLVTK